MLLIYALLIALLPKLVTALRNRDRLTAGVWHGGPANNGSIRIDCGVLREVYEQVGKRPHEHGGVLGGDPVTGTVTHFWFDAAGRRTGGTYSPDVAAVNHVINNVWSEQGVKFLGFVHSHPPGVRRLSGGDKFYACNILAAKRSLDRLQTWLVMPETDGNEYELLAFAADRSGDGDVAVKLLDPVPIDASGAVVMANTKGERVEQPTRVPVTMPELSIVPTTVPQPSILPADLIAAARPEAIIDIAGMFDRVQTAYDLRRLARCRVIFVGVGGARKAVAQLARAGLEEFVLIDPDTVSETNLATQDCYRDEIGRPKVEAAKAEIRRINGNARVLALPHRLDELTDDDVALLAKAPLTGVPMPGRGDLLVDLPPAMTVIIASTDNFYAQARVNRLALKLGIASMCSQVYERGFGAEITFTHPETTPACHRCVLRSRYNAFLAAGPEPKVGSYGAPISTTQHLAAMEMQILLALFHHGTGHPSLGSLLRRIGSRNLIQVRCHPDLATELGVRTFDRVFSGADAERLFADEVVWLPQRPEDGTNGRQACPDCSGTGNLRDAADSFDDTRVFPLG